jgi:hypothetical protein
VIFCIGLKEYIIKGFAMDDERLKDPRKIFGKDYFDEQLERIRDIFLINLSHKKVGLNI